MEHHAKWLEAGEHLRAALQVLAELDEELCTGSEQMFACFMATETARNLTLITNTLRQARELAAIAEWDRCRTCGGMGLTRAFNVHPSSRVVQPCDACDGTGHRGAEA